MEDKSFGRVESISKEHRHQSYWDMFATWVGANANNGTWYVGGVIAACGFATASTTLIIVGVITYFFAGIVWLYGIQDWVAGNGVDSSFIWTQGKLPAISH